MKLAHALAGALLCCTLISPAAAWDVHKSVFNPDGSQRVLSYTARVTVISLLSDIMRDPDGGGGGQFSPDMSTFVQFSDDPTPLCSQNNGFRFPEGAYDRGVVGNPGYVLIQRDSESPGAKLAMSTLMTAAILGLEVDVVIDPLCQLLSVRVIYN
jgi:hypothetical protein